MISTEERRKVKEEVIRRLDKVMDNQGTVNPLDIPENGLPVYLGIIVLLDLLLQQDRRADLVIPVRGINILNPFLKEEKIKTEFKYKKLIESVSKNGNEK